MNINNGSDLVEKGIGHIKQNAADASVKMTWPFQSNCESIYKNKLIDKKRKIKDLLRLRRKQFD